MLFVRQCGQLWRFRAVCLIAAIACTASREGSGGESPARDAPPLPASSLITIDRELYRVRRTADAIEIDIVTPFMRRMSETVRLRALMAPTAMPRFETEPIAGSYRVVYTQAYRSWWPNEGSGMLLPLEQRVSNTFRNQE
jgi:hypothetical protein